MFISREVSVELKAFVKPFLFCNSKLLDLSIGSLYLIISSKDYALKAFFLKLRYILYLYIVAPDRSIN